MALDRILEGRLVRVRAWRPADEEAFARIWGDERVIWWRGAAAAHEVRARFDTVLGENAELPDGLGWCAVEERATGAVVGNAMLRPAPFCAGVELGYHFAFDAWGRGLAADAARTLVAHAGATLRLARVVAAVVPANERSRRVAERAGLRVVGTVQHAGREHLLYVWDPRGP